MTMLRGATNSQCAQRKKKYAHKARNTENELTQKKQINKWKDRNTSYEKKRDGEKEKHAVLQHQHQH